MHEYTAIDLNIMGDKLHLILVKLLEMPAHSISIKIVGMQKAFTAFWYDNLVVLVDNKVIASVVSNGCFNGLNGEFFQCFHLPTPLNVHDAHDNNDQNDRDADADLYKIIHVIQLLPRDNPFFEKGSSFRAHDSLRESLQFSRVILPQSTKRPALKLSCGHFLVPSPLLYHRATQQPLKETKSPLVICVYPSSL